MVRTIGLAIVLASIASAGTVAAQNTPPALAAAATDRDKIICRRFDVTGSLAQKRKVCQTRAEWKKQSARTSKGQLDVQDEAGKMMRNPTHIDASAPPGGG